jgi:hypothetical protein
MVPTWDLVLLVFGGASIVYSLMLRERVVVTLLGAYAAMIVSDRWGVALYDLIEKQSTGILAEQFIQGNLSVLTVQIALFAIVMLIIVLRGGLYVHPESVGVGFVSYIFLMLYGVLTAAVIASVLLGFVPKEQLSVIYENSKFAKYLVDYQAWLLLAPVVLIFISGWGKRLD